MFASIYIPPAQCGADDCTGCQSVQHNPPNPILVAFREEDPEQAAAYLAEVVDIIDNLEAGTLREDVRLIAKVAHFYHARSVIGRALAVYA